MFELPNLIPDVNDVLALEPEELGAKLVFLLRKRTEDRASPSYSGAAFSCSSLSSEPFSQNPFGTYRHYPEQQRPMFELAFAEAWSWLEAQGLLVQASGMNGAVGFCVLSRRARRFEDERDIANFANARLLSKDMLNQKIATAVWAAFMRGEYDVAVFQAMKAVEVAVNTAVAPTTLLGVNLMRDAFRPAPKSDAPRDAKPAGKLTDAFSDPGEQVARMELFAGAIGSYKNPHSHRDVNLDDPAEAIETILLANHLLRIVDARAAVAATSQ